MQNKPKAEQSDERLTEDEIAQAALGGSRGAEELKPAKLTREQRKTEMSLERNDDPGHTA